MGSPADTLSGEVRLAAALTSTVPSWRGAASCGHTVCPVDVKWVRAASLSDPRSGRRARAAAAGRLRVPITGHRLGVVLRRTCFRRELVADVASRLDTAELSDLVGEERRDEVSHRGKRAHWRATCRDPVAGPSARPHSALVPGGHASLRWRPTCGSVRCPWGEALPREIPRPRPEGDPVLTASRIRLQAALHVVAAVPERAPRRHRRRELGVEVRRHGGCGRTCRGGVTLTGGHGRTAHLHPKCGARRGRRPEAKGPGEGSTEPQW
jgi:hypothetical protein